MDGGLSLVAKPAFGGVHDPLKGQIIFRADHEAEIGHGITNFQPLVKARATDDAIGQANGEETILKGAHLMAGAHENGDFLGANRTQSARANAKRLDLLTDPTGLLLAIPVADQTHRRAVLAFCPQLLAKTLRIARNHRRGGL